MSPEATKRDQLDAIVARFERAATKTALLAVVEDAHWCDVATLELLTFLAPKLERLRILLIVSFRPHDLALDDPSHVGLANLMRAARSGRIDLAPLEERPLLQFIDEAANGFPLSPETRRIVARTSEGNPFFVEELLKNAVERLSDGFGSQSNAGTLPSSLRATLLERWRLLGEGDRNVVAQAAVIGRSFDAGLLARTLGPIDDSHLPALARARDVQLLEETSPSRFRFRHALTREAIYAEFLGAQVRPLHRKIATALEEDAEANRSLEGLAYHWWAAGDGERAGRYNELAADAARRVHAHDDAILCYERALESPVLSEADRGRIADKIADAWFTLGFPARARDKYRQAADHYRRVPDDDREARALGSEALAAYTIGRSEPTAALEAMLERLAPDSYLVRARIHLGIAWLTASFWYPTEAARHLALVDPRALDDVQLARRFHNVAAWVAMTIGDLETFRREEAAWTEAAGKESQTASAIAHINSAFCYSTFGLHDESLARIERGLAIARAENNRNAEQTARAFTAICRLFCGDLQGVRAALAAIDLRSGILVMIGNATAPAMLAGLHLDDRELLATWFDEIGMRSIETPDASCGAGFAEILMRRGRDAEARIVLSRSIPNCERIRGILWTLLAAAKYAAPDDVARARELLRSAAVAPVDVAERYGLELFDAYTAHREGRHDEATPHARTAAAGFARLGFPLLEAAALESAGDLEAARTIYQRCGAVGDVRRVMGLRGTSSKGQPQSAQTSIVRRGGNPLSSREAEIAALVARGKSNIEIARTLAISHKTVEKHLGSVYQKLGFTSRAQLAAHLGEGA